MLTIKIPASKAFDEETETFVFYEPVTLKLEHSLISLHKWESKWHKSFLNSTDLTVEENLDYIRCMCIDPNVSPSVLARIGKTEQDQIRDYIHDPMTATTFSRQEGRHNRQIITAELIYYWMISFEIPFECAKWHLNQLFALINVCAIKNNPKKMSAKASAKYRAELNEARRAKLGTSG